MVKKPPANAADVRVRSLGWVYPLEERMAAHSSILAWRIPWTEKPGGLQSWGRQNVQTPRKQISMHNPSSFSQSSLVIVPKVRSRHCAEGTNQVLDNL